MAIKTDARARKTALRIVGILGILVLLCCTGAAWLTYSISDDLQASVTRFDTGVGEQFPDGTVWRIQDVRALDGSSGSRVLILGLPDDAPEEQHAELVDRVWALYCDAFAGAGVALDQIALGVADSGASDQMADAELPHAGDVSQWTEFRFDVAQTIERTGRAAPPDAELIGWLDSAVSINSGEDEAR